MMIAKLLVAAGNADHSIAGDVFAPELQFPVFASCFLVRNDDSGNPGIVTTSESGRGVAPVGVGAEGELLQAASEANRAAKAAAATGTRTVMVLELPVLRV
jgi:hypothetical protein